MKLSSKCILSPSHSKEPLQMSLSSSFSRRLVTNGSIKGGGQASPMFPTVGRKRGSGGLENPEPSSPKVTCIGQVRVKTKKQGKKMRARSKRREGEASFRKTEENFQVGVNPDLSRQKSQKSQSFQYQNHQNLQQQECLPHRNQRWVHLPLTICEALRGFGAEFSCFFPCRSSCTREKEVKAEEAGGGGGGDGSGGGQCREGSCGDALTRSRWLVTLQEGDDAKGREVELVMADEEEEEDRTTDNRAERRHRRHVFEDIDIEKLKNEEFVGEEGEEEKAGVSICIPPKNALLLMKCRSDPVKMAALANRFLQPTIHKEDDEDEEEQVQMEEDKQVHDTIHQSEKVDAFVDAEAVEAKQTNPESNEEEVKAEKADEDANAEGEEKVKNEENDVIESPQLSSSPALSAPSEPQNNEVSAKGSTEKGTTEEEIPVEGEEEEENGSKEREKRSKLERESGTLPDCLLLMMCEPKLSMEVSRETWVCTADFIRWLPARPAVKTGGGDREPKKRVAVDSKPPLAPPPPQSIQPARSSCSFPAPVGLSEMSTTTVVGSNGYEPFVLTRCKSEPRRLPAQLGVGAAGVGF